MKKYLIHFLSSLFGAYVVVWAISNYALQIQLALGLVHKGGEELFDGSLWFAVIPVGALIGILIAKKLTDGLPKLRFLLGLTISLGFMSWALRVLHWQYYMYIVAVFSAVMYTFYANLKPLYKQKAESEISK